MVCVPVFSVPVFSGPFDGAIGLSDGVVDMGDVIGTFTRGLTMEVRGDRLYFTARNTMSLDSFSGANLTGHDLIIPQPTGAPFSNIYQIFTWSIPNPDYIP
jgi:hypothetical protein